MMLVSKICCDCRWSCCHGDPSGELARAKELAQISDAAALKVVEEKIAQMATELEDAANRCELLEKENHAKVAELKKALEAS